MFWGIILVVFLQNSVTPEEAIQSTWISLRDASPDAFLSTLTPACSDNILLLCSQSLDTMRTLSNEELGELFASLRLEAAPDEIYIWDSMAVLEMLISSPGHNHVVVNSTMLIDSILTADSAATAFVTITTPGYEPLCIRLKLSASPAGWSTGGLESITKTILSNTTGL